MKVSFDKAELLGAIAPPAGISQTKNTLMAVDGLLFECPPNPKYGDYDTDRDDLCRISAFDLDKGLRTTVKCKIYEEGMFIINTVKILQIVRSLPDGEVILDIDDKGRVKISCGNSNFEISAKRGDEFPSMPMFIGDKVYTLPQHRLKRIIEEVNFAVGQDDVRAAYNGALMRVRDGYLTATACDGNRLSTAKCKVESASGEAAVGGAIPDCEVIIPGKFLSELVKLLKDSEDDVVMTIGRRHVFFKIGGIYFFTRVIEVEYIKYEKLFPKSYMTELIVSRSEFYGACERASIVTEGKLGGSGNVRFEISDGVMAMSSVSSGGSVSERIPCEMTGADLVIGFNCRFLLEALRAAPSSAEKLRIRLNRELMGMVIEPVSGTDFLNSQPNPEVYGEGMSNPAYAASGEDEDLFLYFIMPVTLHNN